MPAGLDSADRKLLIGAGVLLVVLVVVSSIVSPQQQGERAEFPSSYSTDWDGAKAAFLLLQDLGYRVQRWERSPTEITGDPAETVLVLANPIEVPSDEERTAVGEFVQRGGRILATGRTVSWILPLEKPFQLPQPKKDDAKKSDHESDEDHDSSSAQGVPVFYEQYEFETPAHFSPVAPSPIIRNAPDITMVSPANWEPNLPSQTVVYENDQTAAVVTYRFGKGEVIWWAAPTPLTNGAIRDASNLNLFLNSVAPSRDVRILWDEYFHGTHGSLWTYFAKTPMVWSLLQFGIVFLAVLATYSRRVGPIRSPASVSRLSPLEFVDTLGDLYFTAHANSAAIQVAHQRLRFVLTRQLGLATNVPAADLARSASQQFSWDEAGLLETLTSAENATRDSNLTSEQTLMLVQELFDYTARLESNGRRFQGKASA